MRPIHRPLFWLASAVWLAGCGDPLPQAVQVELLPKLSVEVEEPEITEGDTAKFIIRLSEPVDRPVGVRYFSLPGTASSNDDPPDYDGRDTAFSPTEVVLNPGQTEYTVEINTNDDTVHEDAETFTLNLHSGVRAEVDLKRYIATVTLLDNDAPATLELADAIPDNRTVPENAGQYRLAFKLYNPDAPDVLLRPGLDITVPLQYGGTAVRGQDFDGPDEITLKKNEDLTEFEAVITLIDDIDNENDKTLEISLGTPDEAILGPRIQTTVTLIDDDGTGLLNDSGLTRCQDDTTIQNCPVATHPGQDGDQDTPMRFSLYAVGADECIVDETTGLMWERKQDNSGGLRQTGASYTWYNTVDNINGGDPGTNSAAGGGFGIVCTLDNCTTSAYIEAVNQANNGAGLCGFTDWRLPRLDELLTLVHYDPPCRYRDSNDQCIEWEATIDLTAFPLTARGPYWSASPSAYQPGKAWVVDFADGSFTTRLKQEWGYLRAVRRLRPGDLPP